MSGTIDRRELAFKALAGVIGGAVGWVPVELSSHGHSLTEAPSAWSFAAGFISMALVAGMIGGMIVAAEGKSLEITAAAKRRFMRGFILCFLLAIPGNYCSDYIFTKILFAGGWGSGQPGSEVYLVIARVISWTFMGFIVGVGVGLATYSLRNILKGAIGGWVGGFVGGLAFDPIGLLSQSGLASRFIGFVVIGLAIGFFIGLVQELTKAAWLAVEAGRLKGRQFRLEGSTVMIGRAEENPVGLFGDPGVQPRHAVIERRADGYMLKNLAVQAGTFINGERIESAELHAGDVVRIGNYELSFHERAAVRSARMPLSSSASPTPAASSSAAMSRPGISPTATAAASSHIVATQTSGTPRLVGSSGESFAVRAIAITQIGRALDNDIVVNDASVSRHHASIEARNGNFMVRDLGSQNGTWLHGERVTEAALDNGDTLKFGDAVFTFNA